MRNDNVQVYSTHQEIKEFVHATLSGTKRNFIALLDRQSQQIYLQDI